MFIDAATPHAIGQQQQKTNDFLIKLSLVPILLFLLFMLIFKDKIIN